MPRPITGCARRPCACAARPAGAGTCRARTAGRAVGDRLLESLDLTRYEDEKLAFFDGDMTAHYLCEQLRSPVARCERDPRRGGFGWAAARWGSMRCRASLSGLRCSPASTAPPDRSSPAVSAMRRRRSRLWAWRSGCGIALRTLLALADPRHPLWRIGLLHAWRSARRWRRLGCAVRLPAADRSTPADPATALRRRVSPDRRRTSSIEGLICPSPPAACARPRRRARRAAARSPGALYGEAARAIAAVAGREVRCLRPMGWPRPASRTLTSSRWRRWPGWPASTSWSKGCGRVTRIMRPRRWPRSHRSR